MANSWVSLAQRLNGPRKINQRKTATAKIKVRRAINFQVRLGMFPPAMSLYARTDTDSGVMDMAVINRMASLRV